MAFDDVRAFYEAYDEAGRLDAGVFQLERARTRELLARVLPKPPAVVLDVGGGAGDYAFWLSEQGHEVHLVDLVPRHVEQASRGRDGRKLASARVGDARALDQPDVSCDAVLLLGPLYHLHEQAERLQALREARRVLRPAGVLAAAGISRYASLLDLLRLGIDDPRFSALVSQDLRSGRHSNPTERLEYFTKAFFHRPDELSRELRQAGFEDVRLLPIEGPGWLARDFDERWADPARREELLGWLREIEDDPALLGVSAHLLALGRQAGRA